MLSASCRAWVATSRSSPRRRSGGFPTGMARCRKMRFKVPQFAQMRKMMKSKNRCGFAGHSPMECGCRENWPSTMIGNVLLFSYPNRIQITINYICCGCECEWEGNITSSRSLPKIAPRTALLYLSRYDLFQWMLYHNRFVNCSNWDNFFVPFLHTTHISSW